MGRLYKGNCSYCHETFAARSRARLLSKMSKHRWKRHEKTMKRKIREGIAISEENPTVQDLMSALVDNVGRAYIIYKGMRKRDYMLLKKTMDALEPYLPEKMLSSWKAIESIHDILAGGA